MTLMIQLLVNLNIVVTESWDIFMTLLCGHRPNSDDFKREKYVIFQLVYYLLHNSTTKTPLHVSIAQRAHNEC